MTTQPDSSYRVQNLEDVCANLKRHKESVVGDLTDKYLAGSSLGRRKVFMYEEKPRGTRMPRALKGHLVALADQDSTQTQVEESSLSMSCDSRCAQIKEIWEGKC